MPTYDYCCEACGHSWELEQRITEDPVKDCPKCHAPKAKRLISGGYFLLKGDGWYRDLYHKPAAKKSDSSASKEQSGASSHSGTSGSAGSASGQSKSDTA
jgi:putative FmdB family regulatory protein